MAVDLDFERYIYRSVAELPAGPLFETCRDRVERRVAEVLAGTNCPWPPTREQRILLSNLRLGRANAKPLADLSAIMQLDARKVKELVQDLRVHFRVQIGALRERGGGYYLISTDEESRESFDYLFSQALSMLRTARAMRPSQTVAELAGQVRLELERGDA